MNFQEKIDYLNSKGWSYAEHASISKRWRCPEIGTFHTMTEALSIQGKLDKSELKVMKCSICYKPEFVPTFFKGKLPSPFLCNYCERRPNRRGQKPGVMTIIPDALADRIKTIQPKEKTFTSTICDLLDKALGEMV